MTRPATTVRVTTVAVGAIYTAAVALSGVSLDSWVKKVLAYLPLAAGLALALWDTYLWRLPPIHRFLHRPRLDGTWIVTLSPTEESHIPDEGNRGPISGYMVVKQTYWDLAVRQYTVESTSDLRAHFWVRANGNGQDAVVFTYENVPKQAVQHRSPRHYGTCQLDPTTRVPAELSGVYFTDRYTKGDMTMRLHDRTTGHASYEATQRHCDA